MCIFFKIIAGTIFFSRWLNWMLVIDGQLPITISPVKKCENGFLISFITRIFFYILKSKAKKDRKPFDSNFAFLLHDNDIIIISTAHHFQASNLTTSNKNCSSDYL